MPIQIQAPDGSIAEFPDGTPDATITSVMSKTFGGPKPKPASFFDQVGGAVSGAVDRLKADVSESNQAALARVGKPAPNLFEAGKQSLADVGRSFRTLGDVGGVLASPFAGAAHALVVEPGADLMDKIPLNAYSGPKLSMAGGKPSITGPKPLDDAGKHAANEGAINTALMGARSPAAPVAAAPAVNQFADMAQRFTDAGVTPMAAAAGGKGAAALTNTVAENPIAGAAVRGRLRGAVDQAQASSQDIASRYGETRGPQITGENVQQGVETFAKDKSIPTTFAGKSSALYDHAFGALDSAMAGKTGAPVTQPVIDDQFPGSVKVGGSQIATPATSSTLQQIANSTQSRSIGELIADPTLSKAAKALSGAEDAKDLSFNDLRRLRTWTRDAQQNPELRQSIGPANLARLESSLTQDIYSNASQLGSPELAHDLQRADQYYAAGSSRIQTALKPFTDAKSGENAYSRVIQAAGSTASADAQRLLSLKRSLSPDEWGDVASNAVSELGKQTAGTAPAGQQGFSVGSFVTNYNKLSPRGKDILFGSVGGGGQRATQLRGALDNLASVADDLKGIEKGANTSNTFVSAQAAGTMAGLVTPHLAIPTGLGLGSMALTGEALTNPLVVRWLTKVASAQRASPQAVHVVVKQLGNASRANAALAPLYQESMKLLAPPHPIAATATAGTQDQQPNP